MNIKIMTKSKKNTKKIAKIMGQALREVLVEQGIFVAENTFCCKSRSFIFINKGCPTQEDFVDAKNFAKKMITDSETI